MIRKAFAVLFLLALLEALCPAQTILSNLETKTGWNSCSQCAGTAGQGTFASHWFKQGIASPALEGSSIQFFLGGTNNYSNAYWWKSVASGSTATNFVYDFYYYLKNPKAPQALEFEVNQGLNSKKYIFGTQCGFVSKVWRVYDAYNHRWVATTIPCSNITAYTWHHVVLEFHRTSTGKSQFVTISINGHKYYLNRAYSPKASNIKTINVAFQMDGNKYQTDYSTWLDKVNLKYW
jgi:hypothetical protein